MTGDDLSAEKKKLGKMITMIDNALAMREAAPKNAILQVVASKVEKMEGLKKNWKLHPTRRRLFSWMRLRLSNSSLQQQPAVHPPPCSRRLLPEEIPSAKVDGQALA